MTESVDLRCTVQTTALGESPAGSAGFAERVLLVELPLPWPKKIDDHELLRSVPADIGPDVKILGVRTTDDVTTNRHRVVCWERTDPFRGFSPTETVLDRDVLASRVAEIATSGPAAIPDPRPLPADHQDLLICTHGTRDRCCGQFGTLLHLELEPVVPPNVRLWRASHTGGHRFAPTGVHFPTGTTWAFLTADLAASVIDRSIPTHALDDHFRGNLGIGPRPAQIAEGRAFLEGGWAFLDDERTVDTGIDADGIVTVTVDTPAGRRTVSLREAGAIPVPSCGEPIVAST